MACPLPTSAVERREAFAASLPAFRPWTRHSCVSAAAWRRVGGAGRAASPSPRSMHGAMAAAASISPYTLRGAMRLRKRRIQMCRPSKKASVSSCTGFLPHGGPIWPCSAGIQIEICASKTRRESPRRSLRRYLRQVGAAEASRNPQSHPRSAPRARLEYAIDATDTKLISYPPSLHKTPASRPSPWKARPAPLSRRSPPARPTGQRPPPQSAGSPSSTRAAPFLGERVPSG